MLNRYSRKKAEIELIQIKDFTQNALNAQNDTFFILDPATGKAIWWNRAFNDISGYSDEEILNLKAPDSYYSDADLEKAAGAIEEMSKKGKATVEISLISKTGTTIPFEYSISPIINYDQKKQFIISIGRDISERKRSESALKKSEARFRAITSTAEDPIFCKDANRRYTFVNQAMARMLAMREEDFIGRTPEEVFDADSAATIKEVDDRTFNGQMVNEIRTLKIYEQEFIFNINVPTRVGFQTPFTNITMDVTIPRSLRDEAAAQGILAGINAACKVQGKPDFTLAHETFEHISQARLVKMRLTSLQFCKNIITDFNTEHIETNIGHHYR